MLAARIPIGYATDPGSVLPSLREAVRRIDPALGHGLFLCGLGDHGGGPTRAEIETVLALLADAGEDAVRRERYRQTRPLRFSETTLGM